MLKMKIYKKYQINSSDKVQHEIVWYNSFSQLEARLKLKVWWLYILIWIDILWDVSIFN